jgi:hypothetical protein
LVLQNKVECLSLASFFSLWVQYSGCSGFPRSLKHMNPDSGYSRLPQKFKAHELGICLFWITSEWIWILDSGFWLFWLFCIISEVMNQGSGCSGYYGLTQKFMAPELRFWLFWIAAQVYFTRIWIPAFLNWVI